MEKQKTKNFYPGLRSNIKYFFYNKRMLNVVIFCALLSAGLSALVPIMYGRVMAAFSEYNGVISQIIRVSIIAVSVNFAYEFVYRITEIGFNKLYFDMMIALQTDITAAAMNITTGFHDSNNSGLFIQRMGYDTDKMASFYSQLILLIMKAIGNLSIITYSLILSPYLSLILIANVVVYMILENYQIKVFFKRRKINREKMDTFTGFVTEVMKGNRDIKALNMKGAVKSKTNDLITDLSNFDYKMHLHRATVRSLWIRIANTIFAVVFLFVGLLLIYKGMIPLSTLLIIYLYRTSCLDFFQRILTVRERAKEAEVSAERISKVFEEYPREQFGDKEVNNLRGELTLKNVKFAYKNKRILNGVDLTIKPNTVVGFVSKSGEGKSSLLSLFVRLYDVSSGKILLDGKDIRELSKESLRGSISLVSQNPYLFNLSFKDNFEMVKPGLKKAEMYKACKDAYIHDFIRKTKNGYNTLIGENGVQLSGGQRQRVAIARALIKNAKVMIFDESTSALDNESQEFVKNTIMNLKKDHTVLIVAHRMTTIKDCDIIHVLDKGKIVASGTHRELLKKSNIYQELYRSGGEN